MQTMICFIFELFISLQAVAGTNSSLESIISIRDQYMAIAKDEGLELGFVPEIREWTRPSLMSWRAEAKAVAVPKWEELSKEQRALITEMAGSSDKAERLFLLLFRWFLVPHELTHAYQDQRSTKLRPSENERFANDMATAFFSRSQENSSSLAEFQKLMKTAATNLKKSSNEKLSDNFFNEYYQQFPKENMRLYARYQVDFILDSLRRQKSLRVNRLFKNLKGLGK